MSESEKEAAENVVRASTTDLYERVFFLGPYARRVSFSSMQNRALNLVWALQLTGRMTKGDHVAVVGGGLSGVTATAALLDLGYRVTMYEDGENVMHRQVAAGHRYIHPTVNRWPERPVEETTVVPYFDWVSSLCSEVVTKVRDEWADLRKSPDLAFVKHATVDGFGENAGGVGVQTETACETRSERYTTVLVTSGFADERYGNARIYPGYWRPDNLEADVDAPENKNVKYLISGCGDGGLIDALRVVHREFRQGRLIVDVARDLYTSGWPGLKSIEEAEASLARNGRRLKEAIASGSDDLRKVYMEAAASMPIEIRERLRASLKHDRGVNFVTLLSWERNPYTPMSAPIHKLLIAHAMEDMVVRHLSRYVASHEADHVMVVPGDTRKDEVDKARKERLDGRVILRHGAQPNFRKFFKSDNQAAEDLIMRQKTLAENLDRRFWREGVLPLKTWPPERGFAGELRKRQMDTANLIRRIAKLPNGSIEFDDDRGFLFYHSDKDVDAVRLANLPETVFGFQLTVASESDIALTEAHATGASSGASAIDGNVIRPGTPIVAALNGRLGPICLDGSGQPFALTAGHLAPPGRFRAMPVNSVQRTIVGTIIEEGDRSSDLVRVALRTDVFIDPSYAGKPAIVGFIDPHEAFGDPVYIERAGGSVALGYVSATRVGVYFRHPGSDRRIEVRNAVRIRSADPSSNFASVGDSGAPVIAADGRLLGIVVCNDQSYTYVLPCAGVHGDPRSLSLRGGAVPRHRGAGRRCVGDRPSCRHHRSLRHDKQARPILPAH